MLAGLVGKLSGEKSESSDEESEGACDKTFRAQRGRACAVDFIDDVEGPGDRSGELIDCFGMNTERIRNELTEMVAQATRKHPYRLVQR